MIAISASPTLGQSAPEPPDNCRAILPERNNGDTGEQPEGQGNDDHSLTETLEGCGGVLKPPPVGDGEIAEPPPDEGETPVIRPDEIPPQQDPQ